MTDSGNAHDPASTPTGSSSPFTSGTGPSSPLASGGRGPLRRGDEGRMLTGVCAGLGRHAGVDPLLFRIGFAMLVLGSGIGIMLYVAAFLLMREPDGGPGYMEQWTRRSFDGETVLALLAGVFTLGLIVNVSSGGIGTGTVVVGTLFAIALLAAHSRGVDLLATLRSLPERLRGSRVPAGAGTPYGGPHGGFRDGHREPHAGPSGGPLAGTAVFDPARPAAFAEGPHAAPPEPAAPVRPAGPGGSRPAAAPGPFGVTERRPAPEGTPAGPGAGPEAEAGADPAGSSAAASLAEPRTEVFPKVGPVPGSEPEARTEVFPEVGQAPESEPEPRPEPAAAASAGSPLGEDGQPAGPWSGEDDRPAGSSPAGSHAGPFAPSAASPAGPFTPSYDSSGEPFSPYGPYRPLDPSRRQPYDRPYDRPYGGPPGGYDDPYDLALLGGPVETSVRRERRERPERPRSFVAGVTLILALIVGGITLAARSASEPAGLTVAGGAVLVVIGGGLLVAAWFGRGAALVAAGTLVSIAVLTASLLSGMPGRFGTYDWAPATMSEITGKGGGDYAIGVGDGTVDLSALQFPAGSRTLVEASVAIGEMLVIVPPTARVEVEGTAKLGDVKIDQMVQGGTGVRHVRVLRPEVPPKGVAATIVLRVSAGIGDVEVRRAA
ncbi:PspC domain-containing protein [Streptosporangium sandarakinum]|uniref:PspC domain-containing protein n=1 Tax=Streptosporangium sandarakinum TaxID=1260955 RepID=UPI0033B0BB7B